MSPKTNRPRKDEGEQPAADVKADDPKRSMDRLATLTRKILKVPKEVLDQLREGSGMT